MLVFEERGKPEYLGKNLSEQSREPTTNSTHINTAVKCLSMREKLRGESQRTLHVAVTTAASSNELEEKFSFYFNEVHRR